MTDPLLPQDAAYQPQWGPWTRQLMIIVILVGSVYLLTLLIPVLQMLSLAAIFAFVMFYPARSITQRTPLPYKLVVTLLYLLVIVLVMFLILVLIPSIVGGVNTLVAGAEDAYTALQDSLLAYHPDQGITEFLGFPVDFNFILMPLRDFLLGSSADASTAEGTSGEGTADPDTAGGVAMPVIDLRQFLESFVNVAGTITGTLTTAITTVTGLLITLILALLVSFLTLLDLPKAQAAFYAWVPEPYQREYALLIRRIARIWNAFFRGQVLIGVVIGLLTWIQLVVMGISGAEVLAIFVGCIALIPSIGGVIALIPLGLVPLLEGSSVLVGLPPGTVALLVVIINLLINQVVWNLLAPVILGDALDLPLPVIIVGVFIGAAVGGILGAFLVAPVMGTLRVLLEYIIRKLSMQDPFPGQEAPRSLTGGLFVQVSQPPARGSLWRRPRRVKPPAAGIDRGGG